MRYSFFLLIMLVCMSGIFAQEVTDAPAATSKIEVILPGVLGDGSPEVHTGDTWWGLRETEVMSYELVQTTVTVFHYQANKEVLEVVPDVEGKYLFMIKGSPLLKEGPVETDYEFYSTKLLPGQSMGIRKLEKEDNKRGYSIFVSGNVKKKNIVEDYCINISGGDNFKDYFQTIIKLQEVNTTNGDLPCIIWVGDLDRDGVPDVLMNDDSGSGIFLGTKNVFMLFLSSEAQEGEIIHKVAEIKIY